MLTKRIFNKTTAFQLVDKGHNIIRTENNHKKNRKWMKVFVFQKTDKFLADLTEITLLKEKNKDLPKK